MNLLPRLELSNLEALNTLYHDFIKEQKYDLECDLGMSNPKINNIKYIYGLAEKYKPKIDKIKTNIFMYPNDNMVYYKDVSIPDEKFEIVDKCILLVSPIFDGYDVDISKEYEYPHEVKLSYLNTLFNDTLFYKTKSISNRIQEIEISFFLDKEARDLLEKAWMFCYKNRYNFLRPIHLFSFFIKSKDFKKY